MENKLFWCIVTYVKSTPFYYCGYYKKNPTISEELKPAISLDFNMAMKLHSKEEAERILSNMNKPDWKVEEHGYF